MVTKLNNDLVLCEKLVPKWELGCRRVTPGDGYLEALTLPNVHLTNTPITSVSANGIHIADGVLHPLDIIICATGFNVSQIPNFPIHRSQQH